MAQPSPSSSTAAVAEPISNQSRNGSRLGDILVTGGALSEAQLEQALTQQKALKLPLGQVLIKLNLVNDEQMKQALGVQLGIPYVDLETMILDRSLARIISRGYAKKQNLLPITRFGKTLTVAMDDPTAKGVVDELAQMTHYAITVVTSSSKSIQRAFNRLYDSVSEAPASAPAAAELISAVPDQKEILSASSDEQGRGDEILRGLLFRALEARTSDLHVEMLHTGLSVRFRIDGVLRQPSLGPIQAQLNRSAREVISRIKILSKMDIAERRRPQDGSFQVAVDRSGTKVNIDLRVSVIPSNSGESVVIRILDRARVPKSLEELGLSPVVLERLGEILARTTGIFLVTGPTGSGKSTTLYSCLTRLNKPEIRILTAEDPVEYVYEELSQSEVNTTIGNTFATYLRAFLRHDPEVIMVGEIRDEETAEMAFRAAQTGHFLLSTMHTNTAIAALPRLIDLKVESSLIGSSLVGVLSQRLVRTICKSCRKEVEAPAEARMLFSRIPDDMKFYAGPGCGACGFTGYAGRMMVADLWMPDDEDLMLITRQASLNEIRVSAERTTFSMAMDANDRLRAGVTTVEELLRVLPYPAIAEHRNRFSQKAK